MGSNPVNFQGAPEGTPAPASGQEPAQQSKQAAPGLDQDDLLSRIDQIMDKKLEMFGETLSRQQQSQRDKQEKRINENFQKRLKDFQDIGVEVTDEMKRGIANKARAEVEAEGFQQATSESSPAQENKPEPKGSAPDQWVNAELQKLFQEYGELTQEELAEKGVTLDNSSPYRFIKSAEAYLQQRKNAKPAGNPFAQTTSIGGGSTPGNPIADVTDPDTLWKLARNKG